MKAQSTSARPSASSGAILIAMSMIVIVVAWLRVRQAIKLDQSGDSSRTGRAVQFDQDDNDPLAERPRDLWPYIYWPMLLIGVPLVAFLLFQRSSPLVTLPFAPSDSQVTIAVAKIDLPAYHLLGSTELTTTTLHVSDLPTDVLTTASSLSGTISLVPIVAGRPITASQVLSVTDSVLISGTLTTAIEGGLSLAFGGQLRPGAIVAAWVDDRRIVDRMLVLDVKRFETQGTPAPIERYVMVLAVPPDQRTAIIRAATEGSLSFSLAP